MFRVIWRQAALDELANLWLLGDATDRNAIREASNRIDAVLRTTPTEVGESRSGDDRIHFESPLGITYEVSRPDQWVRIWHVWDIRRKALTFTPAASLPTLPSSPTSACSWALRR